MSIPATDARGLVPIRAWRSEVGALAGVVAAYASIRLAVLLVLWAGTTTYGERDPASRLWAWDGLWFLRVAGEGYPDELSLLSVRDDSTAGLAFLPLYPIGIRALGWLGVPGPAAGLAITLFAGIAAAVGVYAVARELIPPGAAFLAVVLWAGMPMSIVLTMVYAEALFTALAAWAIWAVMRDRWLLAGALGLLAGLSRPSGLGVGAAVVAAAAAWWWQRRRGNLDPGDFDPADRDLAAPPSPGWHRVLGAAAACAGVPLWWLYVWIVSGRADGWFAVQEFFWGSHFDFGAKVATTGWDMLTFAGRFQPIDRTVYTGTLVALVVAVVLAVDLAVRGLRDHRWLPVAAYAVTLVVLTAGSAGFVHSKMRFLVPIFPLVFVAAHGLARGSPVLRWGLSVAWVLGGAWWSTMMLTVWPYAI